MSDANHLLSSQFAYFLDQKEALLDAYIDAGSDHELFIASYIHGHFSVTAANLMHAIKEPQNSQFTLEEWQQQTQYLLNESIDKAIQNNEVLGQDAIDVIVMRNALFE